MILPTLYIWVGFKKFINPPNPTYEHLYWWQQEHLSAIGLPLRPELGGDVPNLDGGGGQIGWGELIDFVPNLEELLEDSELLLFLEDCLDMNPKPFLL